jgi:Na+/melibiose symporter-like transporter
LNDAQKAELLAIVTPRSPTLRMAAITAGILLWAIAASIIVWAVSNHDEPTASDALAIFALIVVPIFLALVFALQRNLRRMQRVLAGAQHTEERITPRELRHAVANAVSLRRSVLIGALWTVTCLFQVSSLVIRNGRHPLFGDVESYLSFITATVAAGLAIHYLRLAIRKVRQHEEKLG